MDIIKWLTEGPVTLNIVDIEVTIWWHPTKMVNGQFIVYRARRVSAGLEAGLKLTSLAVSD